MAINGSEGFSPDVYSEFAEVMEELLSHASRSSKVTFTHTQPKDFPEFWSLWEGLNHQLREQDAIWQVADLKQTLDELEASSVEIPTSTLVALQTTSSLLDSQLEMLLPSPNLTSTAECLRKLRERIILLEQEDPNAIEVLED